MAVVSMYIYVFVCVFMATPAPPPNSAKRLDCFRAHTSLLFSSYPEVQRPGLEANHLLASGLKVKNERSCASAPPVCVHGVDRGIDSVYPYPDIRNAEYCDFVVSKR